MRRPAFAFALLLGLVATFVPTALRSAAAARVMTMYPNFGLTADSVTDSSSQSYTQRLRSIRHPYPPLHIYYYQDPKNIKTVPRTLAGPGSAGDLGLSGIGMIAVSGPKGGIATGFLISPCHVLTNYHVVFANDEEHPSAEVPIDFYYGQGKDDGFASHVHASPVDHPESVGHGWGTPDKISIAHGDWTLLRLTTCVGKQLGYLTLLPGTFSDHVLARNFETAGVLKHPTPNDRNYRNGLDVEASCQVDGYGFLDAFKGIADSTKINHYCASPPGASGAPIFIRLKDKPMVMALNVGEAGLEQNPGGVEPKNGPSANVAIPIESIYTQLAALLNAEEGYVKDQMGQDWHFGEDLRSFKVRTPGSSK